jgi:hypothetical protein
VSSTIHQQAARASAETTCAAGSAIDATRDDA